jgi:hypothetical protein
MQNKKISEGLKKIFIFEGLKISHEGEDPPPSQKKMSRLQKITWA